MVKMILLFVMAFFYAGVGLMHFVRPKNFLKIVPPYLPHPLLLVQLSGFAEIVLGVGLLFPLTRAMAAWGVIALLIAVFPANVYMYQKGGAYFRIPDWVLLVRLPFQLVLMVWAYCYT